MRVKSEISAGGIVYKRAKSKEQRAKNKQEQILWLVTKHSAFGHWSFPKGLVGDIHKNEDMKEAALREVEEEGGVKAEIIKKLPEPIKYSYRWEDTLIKKTVHYYLMRYISGDPKNHDWEVSEANFVSEEEVKKILTFRNDKQAFKQAKSLMKNL